MRPLRSPGRWLQALVPRPQAQARLVAFPPAGTGVGLYRGWANALPGWLDLWCVCPPGRDARLPDPPVADLETYVREVVADLATLDRLPVALFGHSMGAVAAWEVARALEEAEESPLLQLFASAHRPPTLERSAPPDHLLDDAGLRRAVTTLWGGFGPGVEEDPDTLKMVLDMLREDLRMLETHRPLVGPPLRSPLAALVGRDDPAVGMEEMRAWERETSGAFTLHAFSGGHRYLEVSERQVVNLLAQLVMAALRPG